MVNYKFYSAICCLLFLISCTRKAESTTNSSFGYESLNDSYNSKTNIFERKYSDDTIKIRIILTEDERKKILEVFSTNKFQSFPHEIDCSKWDVSPQIYDHLFLNNFSVKYIHNSDDTWFCPTGKRFSKINAAIQDIILNKPEIKKIKSSDIAYE